MTQSPQVKKEMVQSLQLQKEISPNEINPAGSTTPPPEISPYKVSP